MANSPSPSAVGSYGRQIITEADIHAVESVLRSPWLTQGPTVTRFEAALAKCGGAEYAVAFCNGTAALHAAYLAAGLRAGDEVITTPNTFAATTNMLVAVGAKPIFCDIRQDTWNIDEAKIEALITSKTRAIVPVHFAGHPAAMSGIARIAKKYRLLVIEDACHAFGASYKGKSIGSMSDMTVFSFHPVKPITTAEGGAVLTSNKDFAHALRMVRGHGIEKDIDGFNRMTVFGYNYRLSDLQAALGLSQVKRINSIARKRRLLVAEYEKQLKDIADIQLPVELREARSSWHIYVIRVKDCAQRLPLIKHLRQEGIGVNIHYPAVYKHPYYQKHGYRSMTLTEADAYHESCITLPLHGMLTRKDVAFICDKIKTFFAV